MLKLVSYDYDSLELQDLQLKWENDPALKYLFNYFPDEQSFTKMVTRKELYDRWKKESTLPSARRFAIKIQDRVIGEASFSLGHQSVNRDPKTAWIGIVIGEVEAHGKGMAL